MIMFKESRNPFQRFLAEERTEKLQARTDSNRKEFHKLQVRRLASGEQAVNQATVICIDASASMAKSELCLPELSDELGKEKRNTYAPPPLPPPILPPLSLFFFGWKH
jgi:hypothetical protein